MRFTKAKIGGNCGRTRCPSSQISISIKSNENYQPSFDIFCAGGFVCLALSYLKFFFSLFLSPHHSLSFSPPSLSFSLPLSLTYCYHLCLSHFPSLRFSISPLKPPSFSFLLFSLSLSLLSLSFSILLFFFLCPPIRRSFSFCLNRTVRPFNSH